MKGKSDTGRIRLPKGETANEKAKRFAEPTIKRVMASPDAFRFAALQPEPEPDLTFDQFCQNIITAWSDAVDNDEPINGADAVDYIVKLVADCRDILDRRAIVGAGKKG